MSSQNAVWDDRERVYDELINTLGNLTLTAYNSELSDASFAEKKAHFKGGFDQDNLVISKELHDLDEWNEGAICARAKRLAERALEAWPFPELDAADMCGLGHDSELSAPLSGSANVGGIVLEEMGVAVQALQWGLSERGPASAFGTLFIITNHELVIQGGGGI